MRAAVPRFYFHLYDDGVLIDEEGQELPDLEAAYQRAVENAREMACANIKAGFLNLDYSIEIEDGQGETVLVVTFREAFTHGG